MFNGENIVVTGGTFNVNKPQTAIPFILQAFGDKYVQHATHDNDDDLDSPTCHPGTRTSFLTRLSTWVEDTKTSVYVTWLHGPAGAGKSAIARSLADRLHRKSLLAGSFFFFRMDPRRNTQKALVATLAYQIACNIPETQPHIANAIKADLSICSRSFQTQFKALILEPLERMAVPGANHLARPMLVIIDGLDECVGQSARKVILQTIFDTLPRCCGLKFLIVSRPEYDIERSFHSAAHLGRHINTIGLQGDVQAHEDVRIYLRDNFHRIKQTHPLREHFPLNWPPQDAIDRLVEKSSGHFIYASTVVKYIEHDFDQPQNRLDIVVNLRTTSQKPYAALDALYLNILTSSRADPDLLVDILSIALLDDRFDSIVSAQEAFMKSVQFIESALFLQRGEVSLALLDLKSLVGCEGSIEFWHKSFSDFLLDCSRSNEFSAYPARACMLIAKGCLKLLSDKTGLLERFWSSWTCENPMLNFHYFLSVCCESAVFDSGLQTAMMKYELTFTRPQSVTPSQYFSAICSCLRNYQRSIFKGTEVIERLHHQFDNYLLAELRRSVPLDLEIIGALQAAITPLRIDWKIYKELSDRAPSILRYESCFLGYMYFEGSAEGEAVLCEFFHSKDRAREYYLGESPMGLFAKWMSFFSRTLKANGPLLQLKKKTTLDRWVYLWSNLKKRAPKQAQRESLKDRSQPPQHPSFCRGASNLSRFRSPSCLCDTGHKQSRSRSGGYRRMTSRIASRNPISACKCVCCIRDPKVRRRVQIYGGMVWTGEG